MLSAGYKDVCCIITRNSKKLKSHLKVCKRMVKWTIQLLN